jgi:hypothetical protein
MPAAGMSFALLGFRCQTVAVNGEYLWLIDQSAPNKPQALGSDCLWCDILDLPRKFPVTNPPVLVLAQQAVHEDFE